MGAAFSFLQHFLQLRATCDARIIHVVRNLLRAFGCKLTEPIDELCIATTLLNETVQPITTVAPTFLTGDAQHIELANEITEYDCAVAGHGDNHRTASAILNAASRAARRASLYL